MSVSSVFQAPSGSYMTDDNCAICLLPLNPALSHRLGKIIIHDNSNGAKHPMHEKCLKTSIDSGNGNCPLCRDRISWPIRDRSLCSRIVGVSTVIVLSGAGHATLSYLTGRPGLVSIIPGVFDSFMLMESLWLEHKVLGLQRSLGAEVGISLATSAAYIGIPLLGSIVASQITESIIPNSLITAIFGVIGYMPAVIKLVDGIPFK